MGNKGETKLEEDECIDMILKYYEDHCQGDTFEVNNEVWIHNARYLRELMKTLDEGVENYNRIKNCLILLINLCFGIDKADIYNSKGKMAAELSNLEKENFRSLLREEKEKRD